tara:strand:- start:244 stop:2508 length:2265 start_codon:yes stop_codon:yes gene_type:complete
MALNDAVPSSATDVFKRNAEDADKLLNASGPIINRLGNQLLTWEQISQSHAAWNNRGAWATKTAYAVNDTWEDGGIWYVVLSAYTSGASAAADIAGPNVAVLNGNFGSAATKDVGTSFDQVPLNSSLRANTIADLRALIPTTDGQQVALLGHTLAGIGGGTFYYDASDTTSADNNGTVIVTAGGERWKRNNSGYDSPEMFGCIGNGIVEDKTAFSVALANSKHLVADGRYKVTVTEASTGLVTQDGSLLTGAGTIEGYNVEGSIVNRVPIITVGLGAKMTHLTVKPSNTNATRTDNTSYTVIDSDPLASFSYNENLIGIAQLSDSEVSQCKVAQLWRGIASSGAENILCTSNTLYQLGEWCTQFYNTKGVIFTDNICLYGGASGGAAFSSSKKLVINNNWLKVVGTGINPGGSAAVGFNVEDLVIVGNFIIARDCINLENGALNYTVNGNTLQVIKNYDLVGTNGVGIGNNSDSGGSFAGSCGQGVISNNNIKGYESSAYAYGVKIGTVAASSSEDIADIEIVDNYIHGAAVPILASHQDTSQKLENLTISRNTVYTKGSKGIQVINCESLNIDDNFITSLSSVVLAGYYGISLVDCIDASCNKNTIAGFQYLFRLESPNKVSTAELFKTTSKAHPISGVFATGDISDDGDLSGTKWIIDKLGVNTSTDTRLTLKYTYTEYSPATSIVTNGLVGYGNHKEGQLMTVKFNGNVQLAHNSPITVLKGGINVVPPAGSVMLFMAPADGRLQEVSRDF